MRCDAREAGGAVRGPHRGAGAAPPRDGDSARVAEVHQLFVGRCCVTVPPGVLCQDEAGRLCDVCWMLRCAIGRSDGGSSFAKALTMLPSRVLSPEPCFGPYGVADAGMPTE